ncbi:MAG TPA: (d)CMP kinase [Desulfomonilia bacterium]|nr:(d)CMP kinase [Desulfomonilia bacterium]
MTYRIITLDGPAGSGKSTVAKKVAKDLGYTFLDTGAIYRAAAIAVDRSGCNFHDGEECASVISKIIIRISGEHIFLDEHDVTEEIRSHHISELSSAIASHSAVRRELLGIQRSFKAMSSLVAEGRDTGSVVFPDADIKFYLDADPEERARRRHRELTAKGIDLSMDQLKDDLMNRDLRDSSRANAPLSIPENAVVVDTTHLTLEEVVETILSEIRERLSDK